MRTNYFWLEYTWRHVTPQDLLFVGQPVYLPETKEHARIIDGPMTSFRKDFVREIDRANPGYNLCLCRIKSSNDPDRIGTVLVVCPVYQPARISSFTPWITCGIMVSAMIPATKAVADIKVGEYFMHKDSVYIRLGAIHVGKVNVDEHNNILTIRPPMSPAEAIDLELDGSTKVCSLRLVSDQEFESLFQQVPDMMDAHMPMSEDTRLLKWLTWAGLGDAQAQEIIAEVSYQPTFRAKCRAIKEMGIETEEGVKVSECIAYAYENTFEEAL